ncbi:MAG: DUF1573 domain-containing protein [Anaerolineales bacterium]
MIAGEKQRKFMQDRLQQRRRRSQARLLGGLALVLVLAAGIWMAVTAASRPADHQVAYDESLVVYGETLRAVHEMSGPNLGSIPLLPEDGPQPKIVIAQPFFDFKGVGAAEVVQHVFVIANEGTAPLTISRAYTSCECTTADFTATLIPPGGISLMTLTFDASAHDVRGQTVRRGVIIESNDPTSLQTEIWTQASVAATP